MRSGLLDRRLQRHVLAPAEVEMLNFQRILQQSISATVFFLMQAPWYVVGPASSQMTESKAVFNADPLVLERFYTARAYTVDVQWCSGDGESYRRQIAAAERAASIATFARIRNPSTDTTYNPDAFVKTVLLRAIDPSEDARVLKSAGSDTILLPDDDPITVSFSELMNGFAESKLRVLYIPSNFPNYIQIMFCQNFSGANIPVRVFFHIANKEQQKTARYAIKELNQNLSGVAVASGVEYIRDNSPEKSEIRFFYAEDEAAALRVAELTSKALQSPISAKFIAANETRAPRGNLEVWLGRSEIPVSKKSYLVCSGEKAEKCPSGADWIPCYTPIESWIQSKPACSSFEVRKITTIGGNRCGYDISEVTCFAKGQ